jgi:hypothetical protein
MSLHQTIAAIAFGISLLLVLAVLLVPLLSGVRRKFIAVATGIYASGTLTIFLISILRPTVPEMFVWLSEILTFGVYLVSAGFILYIVSRFEKAYSGSEVNKKKD